MIDRLEELLAQVDEPEEGEVVMAWEQVGAAPPGGGATGGFTPGGSLAAAEAAEPGGRGAPPGGDTEGGGPSPEGAVRELEEVLSAAQAGGAAHRLRERRGEGAGSAAELYRRVSRALTPPQGEGRASAAVVGETVDRPGEGLTAGQLDLAMRRDSRRYDGGMSLY